MGGQQPHLRKSIMLPIVLAAFFVGAAGAGVSATRIHVPTRSASPASLPGKLVMPRGPDRKSTRLNSSHIQKSRMPSSA